VHRQCFATVLLLTVSSHNLLRLDFFRSLLMCTNFSVNNAFCIGSKRAARRRALAPACLCTSLCLHKSGLWMLTSRILSAPHLTFPSRAICQQVSPSTRGRSHTYFARVCGSPSCLRAAGCSSHTMKMLCFIMQTELHLSNCPSGTTGLAELKRRLPIGDTFCSGLTPWHGGARQVA